MQNETTNHNWGNNTAEQTPAEQNAEMPTATQETAAPLDELNGALGKEKPVEESYPPVSETPAQKPVKESGSKRFLHFLFGADTKVGRVMRPLLRGAALFVIAFGFGLLAAYFVIYRPVRAQYDAAVSDVQALAGQLNDANISITALEGEQTVLESTLTIQQQELDLSNYRVYFLVAKNDVLRARLALADAANQPGGPTALAAMDDLETHLADLLPYVKADDPVLADLLTGRLDVVNAELARDSEQARVELENFYSNLLELVAKLFE